MISPQYLAGFFDGEGTIDLRLSEKKSTGKMYPHHTVLLSQSGDNGLHLLEAIKEQYGGAIYQHLKAGKHKATKDAWKLYFRKDEAIEMLKKIEPHLVLKKWNAIQLLEYLQR